MQPRHAYSISDRFPLTQAEERSLLNRYDAVICIQGDELNQVRSWIGAERCLLVPHSIPCTPQPMRRLPKSVGLVASRWHASVTGLRWFLDHAWPLVEQKAVTLDVFGFVAQDFSEAVIPRVKLDGFRPHRDRCYERIDIAISPVLYGAGLKIKTVEALAYGKPLVTTREGASGLEHLEDKAFLIADDAEAFAAALNTWIVDEDKRAALRESAVQYVSQHLNEESCFGGLLAFIDEH